MNQYIGRLDTRARQHMAPPPPRPDPVLPVSVVAQIAALTALAGLDPTQTPDNQPNAELTVPTNLLVAGQLASELKARHVLTGEGPSMLEAGILLQLAGCDALDEDETNAAHLVRLLLVL